MNGDPTCPVKQLGIDIRGQIERKDFLSFPSLIDSPDPRQIIQCYKLYTPVLFTHVKSTWSIPNLFTFKSVQTPEST
jgi:hypothetical protein